MTMEHEFKMGDLVQAWDYVAVDKAVGRFICYKKGDNYPIKILLDNGGICGYANCEPYKEPVKRKANKWEWIKWASSVDALGWVVRSDMDTSPSPTSYFSYNYDINDYQRAKVTDKEEDLVWEDFMVEEL